MTDTPLSNVDIVDKLGCKFMLYDDIHLIKNIRELLPMTLILYQPADIGHFCCVFENKDGINYFDPLGNKPDEPLAWGSISSYSNYTYLTKLLTKPKQIIYNEKALQGLHTSTCGHWCTIRMLCKSISNDEFNKCFENVGDRDKLIVNLYNSL